MGNTSEKTTETKPSREIDGVLGRHLLSAEEARILQTRGQLRMCFAVVCDEVDPGQYWPTQKPGKDECAAVLVNNGILPEFLTQRFSLNAEKLQALKSRKFS